VAGDFPHSHQARASVTVAKRHWWQLRGATETHLLWAGATWWSGAVAVFLYPWIFVLDEAVDFPVSPVLPLALAIAILWMALPFLLTEWKHRRWRSLDPARKSAKANKWKLGGRRAMLVAVVFALGWLAFAT
jgi:hypothetical protein